MMHGMEEQRLVALMNNEQIIYRRLVDQGMDPCEAAVAAYEWTCLTNAMQARAINEVIVNGHR